MWSPQCCKQISALYKNMLTLPTNKTILKKAGYLTKMKQAVTVEIVSDIPKCKCMWVFRRHWFTWNKGYLKMKRMTIKMAIPQLMLLNCDTFIINHFGAKWNTYKWFSGWFKSIVAPAVNLSCCMSSKNSLHRLIPIKTNTYMRYK